MIVRRNQRSADPIQGGEIAVLDEASVAGLAAETETAGA
jgi:hypothetical protein